MKPKYPHMRQWEAEIMDKYHNDVGMVGDWSYDVPLKVRQTPVPSYMTDNESLLWQRITAKRIDAVCERKNIIYIIEIKDRLRPSAIGQVLTYLVLYDEQFAPKKPLQGVVLTEYTDPDMLHVASHYNIEVWVV